MQDEAAVEGRRVHLAEVRELSPAGGDHADDASHSGIVTTGDESAPGVPVQPNRFMDFSEDELLSLSFALVWAQSSTGKKKDPTIEALQREVMYAAIAGSIREAACLVAEASA